MAAATTLAPYQPPIGLAPREALAHAHNRIEQLSRKHESVLRTAKALGERAEHAVKKNLSVLTNTTFAATTAASLGYMNGRYGGDKGYVAKHGIALDVAAAGVVHAGAFALALRETGDRTSDEHLNHAVGVLHTIGDAAVGASVYRWAYAKGVEAAHRAGAMPGAQANGARGGTVYSVTPPPAK
jgi:hypothetical protein